MPTLNEKTIAVHPLIGREVRGIHNWQEWLTRWQEARDFQSMESLLHCGLDVSLQRRNFIGAIYDSVDRLLFYFAVADGWTDSSLFRSKDGVEEVSEVGRDAHNNAIAYRSSELCQQLAYKALNMLCTRFFKGILLMGQGGRAGMELNEIWENTILSDEFFPRLQWFFREEKTHRNVQIPNLPRASQSSSHNLQHMLDFLLNLARVLWKWREPSYLWQSGDKKVAEEKRIAELRQRVDNAKPWMIEILAELGQLDVLREWMLEFDRPCMNKLKEIALRTQLRGGNNLPIEIRQVYTLEEACYSESQTAWFLRECELKRSEHKRLTGIQKARAGKTAADRKLRTLTKT